MSQKTIETPDLGGADDVTVIEVLVKKGDKVNADDQVVTLESDKATLDVPVSDTGKVKEIKVKEGDKVSAGDPLLVLDVEGEQQEEDENENKKEGTKTEETSSQADKKKKDQKSSEQDKEAKEESSEQQKTDKETHEQSDNEALEGTLETNGDSDVHAGPGVRRFARELGINLAAVKGTGPKDRVLKEDVQEYVKNRVVAGGADTASAGGADSKLPAIDFSQFGPNEEVPLSRIKKISGKFLQRNWMMIPHVTQFGEADISSLEEFRQSQKAELAKEGIKLTPLAFVMKAVVASLKAFPQFNSSLAPSGESLIMKKYFHIGVAVDTPDGLVVPVIRDVDKKGLTELAKELAEKSEKAREKKLTPLDMQGGCFSISSLGGIGGTAFTPIINHPEVAILGVSKSTYKPVYQDGEFVPRLTLPLSLSYDHRVVDGADGARFIVHLANMLSDIRNLLL